MEKSNKSEDKITKQASISGHQYDPPPNQNKEIQFLQDYTKKHHESGMSGTRNYPFSKERRF